MEKEELKPCPFCGSPAEFFVFLGYQGDACDGVCCSNARHDIMVLGIDGSKEAAAKEWNTRL